MIYNTITLIEGQGQKGQGQRSQKETSACISETIEATVTKFGTNILGDNALHIILACISETWHVSQKNGKGHIKAIIKQI